MTQKLNDNLWILSFVWFFFWDHKIVLYFRCFPNESECIKVLFDVIGSFFSSMIFRFVRKQLETKNLQIDIVWNKIRFYRTII